MCHQSVGLLARYLQAMGIATVVVAARRREIERVRPPRTLLVRGRRGENIGPPGEVRTHRRVVRAALSLLATAEPGGRVHTWMERSPWGEGDEPEDRCVQATQNDPRVALNANFLLRQGRFRSGQRAAAWCLAVSKASAALYPQVNA